MARAEYIDIRDLERVLVLLQPTNELALRVSLVTGLRISDVLNLRTEQLSKSYFTIQEQKTGKRKKIYLNNAMRDALLSQAGSIYVFPHRVNGRKHRTRQAVFKDMKKVDKMLSVRKNVTPHSMRKIYAVDKYNNGYSLKKVSALLNHSDEAITLLYALADKYCGKKRKKGIDL